MQFSIFYRIFAPLETKMMKNDKNMINKMEQLEENCNFSIFWNFFAPLETKMMKNDQKMKENEKNSRKIAIFHFLGKFLHHWKQK